MRELVEFLNSHRSLRFDLVVQRYPQRLDFFAGADVTVEGAHGPGEPGQVRVGRRGLPQQELGVGVDALQGVIVDQPVVRAVQGSSFAQRLVLERNVGDQLLAADVADFKTELFRSWRNCPLVGGARSRANIQAQKPAWRACSLVDQRRSSLRLASNHSTKGCQRSSSRPHANIYLFGGDMGDMWDTRMNKGDFCPHPGIVFWGHWGQIVRVC